MRLPKCFTGYDGVVGYTVVHNRHKLQMSLKIIIFGVEACIFAGGHWFLYFGTISSAYV